VSITETGVRSSCAASEANCFCCANAVSKPREGGIQNGGELAQFAFRLGDVDALRQIAGGNFHGGGADVFNRLDGARNQPPAAGKAKKQNETANPVEIQSRAMKFFNSGAMEQPTKITSPDGNFGKFPGKRECSPTNGGGGPEICRGCKRCC
jgi:hypothetical protein